MNCRSFELLLEPYLDGGVSRADAAAAKRHLHECERCSELLELARIATRPADPRAAEPPPGLVADVLRTTAGRRCDAAERELCGYIDGELTAERIELLETHLSACSGCRTLGGTLAALASDLPRLAEIRPDAGFADAVLAATLPWHTRLRGWWRRGWPRWILRPRFAAEAAYVTTLILTLVVWTPGSPLEAMPKRAAELARRTAPAGTVGDPWARLNAKLAPKLEAVRSSPTTRAVLGSWRTPARLGSRALEIGGDAWRGTAQSIRTFWHRLASVLESAGETPSAADRESDEENG